MEIVCFVTGWGSLILASSAKLSECSRYPVTRPVPLRERGTTDNEQVTTTGGKVGQALPSIDKDCSPDMFNFAVKWFGLR